MRFAVSAGAALSGRFLPGVAFHGESAVYIRRTREQWDALMDRPAGEHIGEPDMQVGQTAQLRQQVRAPRSPEAASRMLGGGCNSCSGSYRRMGTPLLPPGGGQRMLRTHTTRSVPTTLVLGNDMPPPFRMVRIETAGSAIQPDRFQTGAGVSAAIICYAVRP